MTNPELRRGRHSEVGAYSAVTAVCRRRQPFFIDPALAVSVASQIRRIAQSGQVASLAWVIMPDHLHWLFRLRSGTLDRHIQALRSCSAITVNRLRGGQGSIWPAGYYDHRLRSEEDCWCRLDMSWPIRCGPDSWTGSRNTRIGTASGSRPTMTCFCRSELARIALGSGANDPNTLGSTEKRKSG